jgi:hypothetical protein
MLDGRDPTGYELADACARLGHDTVVVDLRRSRLELEVGPASGVRIGGEPLVADVVVNRTGVNGLGLAAPAALVRQSGRTWYELHSAAREEQGLLLAIFDHLLLGGVRVINPPEAAELELMRNLVIERLGGKGIPVNVGGAPDVRYLVAGGRIALQPGQHRPDPMVLRTCKQVAGVAEFDLGEVSFEVAEGAPRLVEWTSAPDLGHLDPAVAGAMSESVMRALLGETGHSAPLPSRPFIEDMIERYE